MKKQYTYQDLETFFDQFKRMPEYITMEKVAQILQQPSPSFTLPRKGASFKLLSILLTTATVISIASILYFSSSSNRGSLGEQIPVKKDILRPDTNAPAVLTDTFRTELQEAISEVKERIYIPNQAAHEFLRNRLSVTSEQSKEYTSAIKSIRDLVKKR